VTSYEVWCICVTIGLNVVVSCLITFACWLIVKFKDVRDHILEAAQDGDKVTHWTDGKNVVSLVLGLLSAWFTSNLIMIFVYNKMFEVGPGGLMLTMIGITFTLLGIAWKKP